MIKGIFECPEIRKMCMECEKKINHNNQLCAFRSLDNEYCEAAEKADNALAYLKKYIVDKTIAEIQKPCVTS